MYDRQNAVLHYIASLFVKRKMRMSKRFSVFKTSWVLVTIIHGVHFAGLSDFSVRGAARRHFSRQVAHLFRRKFRQ
jgi:hypothetical protein